MKTDDANRVVVLASQHVLDHRFEIAGGVGLGPDLAAFAAIVHHQIDGLIVLAGHDRWCPTGPVHHQLQRYMTLDSNRPSPNRSGRGITVAILDWFSGVCWPCRNPCKNLSLVSPRHGAARSATTSRRPEPCSILRPDGFSTCSNARAAAERGPASRRKAANGYPRDPPLFGFSNNRPSNSQRALP